MKFKTLVLLSLLFVTNPLCGYVLEGQSWTRDRTVVMQFSLGPPRVLQDGSTSFNQVALDAINIWNPYLEHLSLAGILNSPVTPASGDDEISALFDSKVFGDDFDPGVLAITLLTFRGTTMEETDTVFNTAFTWDSYRGPQQGSLIDFRRVAIHEFGHSLGLDHPDDKGQTVPAIMNSHSSDIDTVQPDDIAGVKAIYDTGPAYQNYRSSGPAKHFHPRFHRHRRQRAHRRFHRARHRTSDGHPAGDWFFAQRPGHHQRTRGSNDHGFRCESASGRHQR